MQLKSKSVLALISIIIAISTVYVFKQTKYYGLVCESLLGGKFASSYDQCIMKDCYSSKSCGKWSAPRKYCQKLAIGSSISDVYFWLGEPTEIDGEKYSWNFKTGEVSVIVNILNNSASSINCNPT